MKYPTVWNLDLIYKGDADPRIEKDQVAAERAIAQFEKKYRAKKFTSSAQALGAALSDYVALLEIILPKAEWYYHLRISVKSDDAEAVSALTRAEQRMNKAKNAIAFFMLEIAKIVPGNQKKFLASSVLAPYRYLLERIFITAKHNLSEKEEQLAALLSQTSYSLWVEGQQRALSQKTVIYKNRILPLEKALRTITEVPKKERAALDAKVVEVFKECAPFAESEINAIYNYKKIMDECAVIKSHIRQQ